MVHEAMDKLRAQQSKVKERSAPWMVAEQLMDICRREPESAALIAQDLDNPEMGIVQAERKIKAFADQHRVGNSSGATGAEAEDILRKFYGLPKPGAEQNPRAAVAVDLAEFFG